MNKLVIAMALCAALAACNKQDAAPADTAAPATDAAAMPADAAATPADAAAMPADPAAAPAAPSDMAAAPADAAAATVPPACEEYFKRAEACYAKAGGAGAAMKSGFDTARAQMAGMPAAQMEAGCKAANDQFAQTAAALKCE